MMDSSPVLFNNVWTDFPVPGIIFVLIIFVLNCDSSVPLLLIDIRQYNCQKTPL